MHMVPCPYVYSVPRRWCGCVWYWLCCIVCVVGVVCVVVSFVLSWCCFPFVQFGGNFGVVP